MINDIAYFNTLPSGVLLFIPIALFKNVSASSAEIFGSFSPALPKRLGNALFKSNTHSSSKAAGHSIIDVFFKFSVNLKIARELAKS